ncbi:unnamed protein product [Strongylus vulgaris]|uniref:LITAF domain-containing protein n=1 Tax=Strongylus vulgaris TaxID=40348 RepID=A0A3P7KWZ7_STRVU|nr:unnamed protein product [Strongylus vulgaris]
MKVPMRTDHTPPVLPNNKYENTLRYDQTRNVPTYPVKTADPSTCTQYAPVRTLISSSIKSNGSSSSRRTSSRSAQKKEAIDPKRVEDEVARNVSQILSATKQQRLAMEAQQRNGTAAPQPPRIAYACPDCHKTVTSARNLQSKWWQWYGNTFILLSILVFCWDMSNVYLGDDIANIFLF